MNIELKPIAESKVRQLGGDVCGVLVRDDSGVMAVSEHGRCTRLDAGVMGPVSNAPASDRDEFEKWFSDNHVKAGETVSLQMKTDMWAGFQAARAQGGQGAEAVAYATQDTLDALAMHRANDFPAGGTVLATNLGGGRVPLYTQPQPAVPEAKEIIDRVVAELETGFVRCERCGDQEDTATLDCMTDLKRLKAILSTPTTPQADGWVGCEDRLPEHGQKVRTKDSDGRQFDCEYFHWEGCEKGYFKLLGKVWNHETVIQWMPAPAGQEDAQC